ncbi:pimeloyl-ACP methyl ester carboxylesterase [Bradyrhizobium sp. USDA 4516]
MTWLANQDRLRQVGSVFVCELPAHGNQPPLASTMTISGIVDELIKALDIQCERFVMIGHSLGGAIAIELAARRPDLVAALALLAPAGLGKGIDSDFLGRFPTLSDMDTALALLRRLVARPRLITPPIAERVLGHLHQSGVRAAMQMLAHELLDADAVIKPHAVSVTATNIPRLVVWGEDDRINPIDGTKLAAFSSKVITLPDTGHLPHIEASKAVNGHLVNFLKSSLHETMV